MIDALKLLFSSFPISLKARFIWFFKNLYFMSWSKPRKLKSSTESNNSDRNQIWSSFEGSSPGPRIIFVCCHSFSYCGQQNLLKSGNNIST